MDNQAYLDQIAASNRPLKPTKFAFLSSKIFKIIVAGIGAIVAVVIVGNIISGISNGKAQEVFDFRAHVDHLSGTIRDYQGLIKSSSLRSQSASLSTILSTTSTATTIYINENYAKNTDIVPSESEIQLADARNSELYNAKINGLLDRTYARKLVYEISVIMASESKLIKSAKTNSFKTDLQTSYNSLSIIKESIENLSL